jgi:Uma2 family endonuclease
LSTVINASVANSLADRVADLGGVGLDRIVTQPAPGSATVHDAIVSVEEGNRCEWVDGTLVEKAMGWQESLIAMVLGGWLNDFVRSKNLGVVIGPDGFIRILDDVVRAPDVSFLSWDRLPGRQIPQESVPACVPDLAVEILSTGNTRAEMARKRREYFHAGVRLVWMIDPRARTVAVYTGSNDYTIVDETGTLSGGEILPGLTIKLESLFAELDRKPPAE